MRIALLANPAAGRGRGARALHAARRAFEAVGVTDVRLTTAPGDEARLVREALHDGCATIAVLGGDGTWSKAARAAAALGADCRLALLAAGTGNDFVKSLALPAADYRAMARLAVDGPDRRVDLGRVGDTTFLNVAGFGFDAAVLADTTRGDLPSGPSRYAVAALRHLFRYPGFRADVRHDGGAEPPRGRPYLFIVAANGQHFGGAFRIAPAASPSDGLLDLVTLGDATALRRLSLFGAALSGRHVHAPETRTHRTTAATLTFDAPPMFEADGELHHAPAAVVEIACVPGAVRIVVGR